MLQIIKAVLKDSGDTTTVSLLFANQVSPLPHFPLLLLVLCALLQRPSCMVLPLPVLCLPVLLFLALCLPVLLFLALMPQLWSLASFV